MAAARFWSSQNPGSPIACSSSPTRDATASGSKVITNPGELGSDLLELLVERDRGLGHGYAPWQRLNFLPLPHQQGSLRPTSLCSLTAVAVAVAPRCGANAVLTPALPAPAAAITSAPAAVSCSYWRLPLPCSGASCGSFSSTWAWKSVRTTSSRIVLRSSLNIA